MTNESYNPYALEANRVAPTHKNYWGIRHVLYSLLVFFGVSIVTVGVYTIVSVLPAIGSGDINQAADDAEKALYGDSLVLILLSTIPMYLVWLSFAWFVSAKRSGVPEKFKTAWAAFKHNFWLEKIKGYDVFIGLGVAAGFILLQILFTTILGAAFPDFDQNSTDNTAIFNSLNGPAFFIIGFGIVGFLGPIMEEIFFRGFMLRAILNRFNKKHDAQISRGQFEEKWLWRHREVISVVIVSIIFGAFHTQALNAGSLVIVLITGSLGFGLGIMTVKLKRIAPAIFAHIFHNSFAIATLALDKYFVGN